MLIKSSKVTVYDVIFYMPRLFNGGQDGGHLGSHPRIHPINTLLQPFTAMIRNEKNHKKRANTSMLPLDNL